MTGTSQRMQFIPELREGLIRDLTERQHIGTRSMVVSALELWDTGADPRTPFERGCFEVFKKVQADIEAR